MATEAQRLIGISLTKIAQSRAHRGGVSLHKNLLVATVLQKARFIFMEEAYHMVHAGGYCPPVHAPQQIQQQSHLQQQQHSSEYEQQSYDDEDESLVALTPEEAGISETSLQEFLQPSCIRCSETSENRDKENVPPTSYQQQNNTAELTYLDLDKTSSPILRERSVQQCETTSTQNCLKRRRAVTEWETEEAVLSILPKKSRPASDVSDSDDDGDDSVFLDEAALFSDCIAKEAAAATEVTEREQDNSNGASSAMEIDRITSLVSIFSFGGLTVSSSGTSGDGLGKLSRSVSTPDLCSAQAKESAADALQQRPFLAMTV